MKVVYDSLTGLGEEFASKVSDDIQSIDEPLDEVCILVTRNEGMGDIPYTTVEFLEENKDKVLGVVSNGNLLYGEYFALSGEKIEAEYGIPAICKIEEEGNEEDVAFVKTYIEKLEQERNN